jgi:hypothetical protein
MRPCGAVPEERTCNGWASSGRLIGRNDDPSGCRDALYQSKSIGYTLREQPTARAEYKSADQGEAFIDEIDSYTRLYFS